MHGPAFLYIKSMYISNHDLPPLISQIDAFYVLFVGLSLFNYNSMKKFKSTVRKLVILLLYKIVTFAAE